MSLPSYWEVLYAFQKLRSFCIHGTDSRHKVKSQFAEKISDEHTYQESLQTGLIELLPGVTSSSPLGPLSVSSQGTARADVAAQMTSNIIPEFPGMPSDHL